MYGDNDSTCKSGYERANVKPVCLMCINTAITQSSVQQALWVPVAETCSLQRLGWATLMKAVSLPRLLASRSSETFQSLNIFQSSLVSSFVGVAPILAMAMTVDGMHVVHIREKMTFGWQLLAAWGEVLDAPGHDEGICEGFPT